jgi:hypothetical protein
MNQCIKWATIGVLSAISMNLAFVSLATARNDSDNLKAQLERDRQSILAMAGAYKVTFDMRETVPFVVDYHPIPAKTSGGHEVVKVIEDSGTSIDLQHILVVTGDEGEPDVVKHWRQRWTYQPKEVLVYSATHQWRLKSLSSAERNGAWSQTVWQTDDSPRYGGIGRWVYDDGMARWTSNATLRPLARRDAIRYPLYNRYLGTNRQALTPTGWVHEQDNAKLGLRDGKSVTFVHEVVINTYARDTAFDTQAADLYWEKTQDYWSAVRNDWESAIQYHRGIRVQEEASNGSKTGSTLMKLAHRLANSEIDATEAIAAAKSEISSVAAETATTPISIDQHYAITH